jgi:EAL domain-containing protein (putative c-di-GMP-specific phosphodiesterase class I)
VFIPIAEGYNLIVPLTRYVIAETARQLSLFPHDKHFHISINVAARHFADGELLRDLHKLWFSAYPVQQLVVNSPSGTSCRMAITTWRNICISGRAGYR